ncbi:MAG: hypothetical protein HEQ37_07185 [Acidovorax sp.]|nr:hypothetical protein [Acidovorax sp.]
MHTMTHATPTTCDAVHIDLALVGTACASAAPAARWPVQPLVGPAPAP